MIGPPGWYSIRLRVRGGGEGSPATSNPLPVGRMSLVVGLVAAKTGTRPSTMTGVVGLAVPASEQPATRVTARSVAAMERMGDFIVCSLWRGSVAGGHISDASAPMAM